jgi:hypothetical protein
MIMSKLPVMVFIATVLVASVGVLTVPAANALTQRDYTYLNDNHLTARYGETAVCGDHMCAPGEWDKLQASLTAAQLGYQGGRNATQTSIPSTSTNSTTVPSTLTPPSTAPASVCQAVQNTLNSAGVTPAAVAKVMADLGCS